MSTMNGKSANAGVDWPMSKSGKKTSESFFERVMAIAGSQIMSPLGSLEDFQYAVQRAYSIEAAYRHQAKTRAAMP